MILRSLLAFLACSIGYTLLVYLVDSSEFEAINQNQGNVIASQEFFLNKAATCTHFITGSSLSYRVKNQMLPDNYWNLSVGGGSFFKGLEMIKAAAITPEVILIETNILDRGPSSSPMTKADIKNADFYLRKNIAIAQQKNQPISFGLNVLKKMIRPKANSASSNTPIALKEKALQMQEEAFRENLLDNPSVTSNVVKLKEYVNYFDSLGVCIVLYEMPVSCSLLALPKSTSGQKLLERYLPRSKYTYLPKYDCQEITTSDGIHLEESSALVMKNHLLRELAKVNCAK